jgi:hypothetical protein
VFHSKPKYIVFVDWITYRLNLSKYKNNQLFLSINRSYL